MNLYDTKQAYCSSCEKALGEIDYDVMIFYALCPACVNNKSQTDNIPYIASYSKLSLKEKHSPPLFVKT